MIAYHRWNLFSNEEKALLRELPNKECNNKDLQLLYIFNLNPVIATFLGLAEHHIAPFNSKL